MDLGIKGRVAAVAASSRGLGFAAAMELAKEGAKVALCARSTEQVQQAAAKIRESTGAAVAATAIDLASPTGPDTFIRFATHALGAPEILVTNNGGPPATKHDTTTDEQWLASYHQTLMCAIRLISAALPAMKARQWGRIINITSIAVKQPIDGLIISNALRAGLTGYARTLANEVGIFGITVNNVCPGYTRTERLMHLAASRPDSTSEEYFQRLAGATAVGRIGEPDELAALIAFLAGTRAAFITGATIPVDGGYYKGLM